MLPTRVVVRYNSANRAVAPEKPVLFRVKMEERCMRWRRTLGIGMGLFAVAAFTVVHAQQPAAPAPPGTETLPAAGTGAPGALPLKTLKDRASYAIGVDIARGLKTRDLDLDTELLTRGLTDTLAGKPQMDEKQFHATLVEFEAAQQAKLAETNKKQGAAFLAENKKREGVVTLASGLQYKVVKQGAGATPKPNDTVTTQYRGRFLNGQEFDSSYASGGPVTFAITKVIPGWTEALQLMKEGDQWQLFVPADLAYGEKGFQPAIPPNATLVFDIELLKVNHNAAAAPAGQGGAQQPGQQPGQ